MSVMVAGAAEAGSPAQSTRAVAVTAARPGNNVRTEKCIGLSLLARWLVACWRAGRSLQSHRQTPLLTCANPNRHLYNKSMTFCTYCPKGQATGLSGIADARAIAATARSRRHGPWLSVTAVPAACAREA